MGRTLREKMNALDVERRAHIESEAERLHTEYLTLRDLRKAKDVTQVQLAEALGSRQATVAKYERQSDLLLSTLGNYIRGLGGELSLVVRFPGRSSVTLEGLGEPADAERPGSGRPREPDRSRPAGE